MASLLFFKWDHSVQSLGTPAEKLAALPKRFDLIEARPDDWVWGKEELSNPRGRIILWPPLTLSMAAQFLSPLLPEVDMNLKPTTIEQYRGFYLDLTDIAVPVALRTWWQDDTRTQPIFTTNISPATVIAAVKKARSRVPIAAG